MRKLFFSFLIFAVADAFAQKNTVPDTARSYVPTGFRIGTDLITFGKSFTNNHYKGWELNFDTDFWKYNFAVDYGFSARQILLPTSKGAEYSNTGHYVRVGIDVNFLLRDPDRNRLFVGIRYARGLFGEGLVFTDSVKNYGPVPYTPQNDRLQARWMELVTGISLKVWKGLWMGYTGRLKFSAKVSGDNPITTYEIPGYGLKSPSFYWGFNYQIFWRFSWKKTGALSPGKDK